MKKLIIISTYLVKDNKALVGTANKLIRLGLETFDKVTYVTSNFDENFINSDIDNSKFELVNLPIDWTNDLGIKKYFKFYELQKLASKFIEKNSDDETLICFWIAGPMLLPMLKCKKIKQKTLYFLYGNSKNKASKFHPINNLVSILMKTIAKKSTYIGVESKSVLSQQWNIPFSEKTKEIFLYSGNTDFKPYIDYNKRENILGFASRLIANKRVLEVIQAFNLIKDKYPTYKLEIVGTGNLEKECQDLINQLNLSDRIKMLGWIDNNQIHKCFNNWKLFLFPTKYEGLPNTLLESMSCGTPVLASGVGGILDVINDCQNGFIIEDISPECLANQIDEILSKNDLTKISENAYNYVSEKYSFESSLNNFKQKMKEMNSIN